jgi:hypothetical protein
MPCADSNTICALRQVTTEPVERRRIRSNRLRLMRYTAASLDA